MSGYTGGMNRRSFLGLLAGLPFVGRLAPVTKVRYFTRGGCVAKGSDTVPQMLNPGERVLIVDDFHAHQSREFYDAIRGF